jgi:hypothetical protein
MCRPAGAHFEGHDIGYKYAAPLGLSDFAYRVLNQVHKFIIQKFILHSSFFIRGR